MNNLYNLHGDSEIYQVTDLLRFATNPGIISRTWNLLYDRCKRLKLRYEYFC